MLVSCAAALLSSGGAQLAAAVPDHRSSLQLAGPCRGERVQALQRCRQVPAARHDPPTWLGVRRAAIGATLVGIGSLLLVLDALTGPPGMLGLTFRGSAASV